VEGMVVYRSRLLAQFETCNTIEAYAGLSGLYGQFSMYLRRHPGHKFPAEMFACDWLRDWLTVLSHVRQHIRYKISYAFQGLFRGIVQPTY
jgi:hypothetical protein